MHLRLARHVARLSQHQLAQRANVDHSFISLLESGKRDIESVGYAVVVRIARALNVEPHDLFPTLPQTTKKRTTRKPKLKLKRSA
jgi:transcriptional regulator with XRE-family HTH domain